MGTNRKDLKAYVRYDGSGRVVPSSLILRRKKPKVGKWVEVPAYECCAPTPTVTYNFDITADWSLTTPPVVDEASFRTFLESGQDGNGSSNNLVDVVITDFLLQDGRLRCNLSGTSSSGDLNFRSMDITSINGIGNISGVFEITIINNSISTLNPGIVYPEGLITLYLDNNNLTEFNPTVPLPSTLVELGLTENQIVTFDPSIALPNSLEILDLSNNQIVTFDPTIALPDSLRELYLYGNQIVTFDPTLPLPSSLVEFDLYQNQIVIFNPTLPLPDSVVNFYLESNQMTTAGYIASEPWANAMSVIPGRGSVYFNSNINSVSGTNLETILTAKGWTVFA